MTALIKKLYASDVVRYVFFGGCTTLVNLVSFFLLRQAGVQRDLANVISIILAILFAMIPMTYAGEPTSLHGYIYSALLQPVFGDKGGSLIFALLFVLLNWAIGYILYKKKIYIKI